MCNDCHRERDAGIASLIRFDLYDLLRGPVFIAAWVVFALGCLYRVIQSIRLTVRAKRTAVAGGSRGDGRADRGFLAKGRSAPSRLLLGITLRVRNTILGSNPVMASVSLLFHFLLFLAPLLLPAHNTLFDLTFRVSLPSLPERLVDWFTVVLLAAGGFFLLRRLLIPRARALTTARDWLVLGLVMAPFVTAYLAYHQVLDYRIVLATHMAVGELVIAAIPFTAIGHMPFILFARFFTSGEYAWKPGNRRWR
jgi:nitrate reductase gamma subunit